jgi:hypothetical protein
VPWNASDIERQELMQCHPSSFWSEGVEPEEMMKEFISKHLCTHVCRALHLPQLVKIPWTPSDLKVTKSNPTGPEKFNPNSAAPQLPEDQCELLDMVRRGQKILVANPF